MYLSTVGRATSTNATTTSAGESRRRTWSLIGANVLALGTVSLVTDVSAEMVTAILPVYLVFGLHLSVIAYGVVDGVYTGATALLRLVGGYVADRVRHRKLVAGLGYGLSAVAKLGLLGAGGSAGALGFVLAIDRTGKGLRTAPRDALISLSAPSNLLGRAFGLHRAMTASGRSPAHWSPWPSWPVRPSRTTRCSSHRSASPRSGSACSYCSSGTVGRTSRHWPSRRGPPSRC